MTVNLVSMMYAAQGATCRPEFVDAILNGDSNTDAVRDASDVELACAGLIRAEGLEKAVLTAAPVVARMKARFVDDVPAIAAARRLLGEYVEVWEVFAKCRALAKQLGLGEAERAGITMAWLNGQLVAHGWRNSQALFFSADHCDHPATPGWVAPVTGRKNRR